MAQPPLEKFKAKPYHFPITATDERGGVFTLECDKDIFEIVGSSAVSVKLFCKMGRPFNGWTFEGSDGLGLVYSKADPVVVITDEAEGFEDDFDDLPDDLELDDLPPVEEETATEKSISRRRNTLRGRLK